MKLTTSLLLVALALCVPGCGAKKLPNVPATSNEALEKFNADLNGTDPEAHQRVLTEALGAYFMTKNDVPKDLNDLVTSGLIPKLPAPPEGQKFEIDKTTMRVVLVSQ